MFNDSPPSPRKSCCLEIMWKKCCRAGQATDDSMAHAHFMLDNTHSENVIRLFRGNSGCTNVPSVTLYVCCLSCYYFFIVIET